MSLETDLVAALGASAPVAAIVGDRVHPWRLPERPVFPAIVYQVIGRPHEYAHDGPAKLSTPVLQLSLWGGSGDGAVLDVIELSERVRELLGGFAGDLGGGARVAGLMLIDERDDVEPDTGWFRKIQDWRGMRREEA